MITTRHVTVLFLIVSFLAASVIKASARDDIGSIVAIRGKAFIERDKKEREARVKDGLLFEEAVATREASRAKLLFIDDSVITLGESSRVVVREFLSGKDKKGKSIFNVIDGKLKAVVGKNEFEVHTPSAVAAARGTVFIVSVFMKKDTICTTIFTEKDTVSAIGTDPENKGNALVKEDMIITICRGEPFPSPHHASAEEKKQLLDATNLNTYEISLPSPLEGTIQWPASEVLPTPAIDQQPVTQKRIETIVIPPPSPPVSPPLSDYNSPILFPPPTGSSGGDYRDYAPAKPPCTDCNNNLGIRK